MATVALDCAVKGNEARAGEYLAGQFLTGFDPVRFTANLTNIQFTPVTGGIAGQAAVAPSLAVTHTVAATVSRAGAVSAQMDRIVSFGCTITRAASVTAQTAPLKGMAASVTRQAAVTADIIRVGVVVDLVCPIGQGGGAPAFGPDDLAGLAIWLDASQLALADGAEITTWPNLANPALTGVQQYPSPNRPQLRADALNGLPVAHFPSPSGLRWSGTGIGLNWTVVYVGRVRTPGTGVGRVVTSEYPNANLLVGFWNFYEDAAFVGQGFLTPDARKTQTSNWKLYTATGEGVPGNAKAWFYGDGEFLSGDHPVLGGWEGYFNLNGYGFDEICDCEVAEVVFYDRRLSDVERGQVEDYLRSKWLAVTTRIGEDGGKAVVAPSMSVTNASFVNLDPDIHGQAAVAAQTVKTVSFGCTVARAAAVVADTQVTNAVFVGFSAAISRQAAVSADVQIGSTRLLATSVTGQASVQADIGKIIPFSCSVARAASVTVTSTKIVPLEARIQTIIPICGENLCNVLAIGGPFIVGGFSGPNAVITSNFIRFLSWLEIPIAGKAEIAADTSMFKGFAPVVEGRGEILAQSVLNLVLSAPIQGRAQILAKIMLDWLGPTSPIDILLPPTTEENWILVPTDEEDLLLVPTTERTM